MHSFLDAKLMAKALRKAMAERHVELSHTDCLEVVSRQFGLADWNTLAARIAAATGDDALPLPESWFITGNTERTNYRIGLDPTQPGTAIIECRFHRQGGIVLREDHYGVLMQSIQADDYRGGRIRLSATLKADDADAGSIWMRVDKSEGKVLQFDNMMTREVDGALRGSTGWLERNVVLDVPAEASSIHYGLLLQGYGRISAQSFQVEAVDAKVSATPRSPKHLPRPTNLDLRSSGLSA